MAKSIKSKIKRKMRNIKREKVYGPKEMAKLKLTVAKLAESTGVNEVTKDKELVTVRQGEDIVKEHQEKMETEANKKFDKKTKKDENGQYPEWMNQRQIKKQRATNKNVKQQKAKPKAKRKHVKW